MYIRSCSGKDLLFECKCVVKETGVAVVYILVKETGVAGVYILVKESGVAGVYVRGGRKTCFFNTPPRFKKVVMLKCTFVAKQRLAGQRNWSCFNSRVKVTRSLHTLKSNQVLFCDCPHVFKGTDVENVRQ